MKKIKKPLKKSELKQIIARGFEERREKWKKRLARNNKWTKEWKLREKNLSNTVEMKPPN